MTVHPKPNAALWAKVGAVIAGVMLAFAFALSITHTVPAGAQAASGSTVSLSVGPTGELEVSPAGSFLYERDLRPGGEAQGSVRIRNQTGRTLEVRAVALGEGNDLDETLGVRADLAGRTLWSGTLGKLRSGAELIGLRSGETRLLTFTVWLPGDLRSRYEGRVSAVTIGLSGVPAGS